VEPLSNEFRLSQVIRFNDPNLEKVDITGAQMVLTMKLTTFAWNVWDGQRPVQVGDHRSYHP
jgi:lysophospholipid acyltransferase